MSNTIYATTAEDSLGRDIRITAQDRAAFHTKPNKKRYVGIFYFLWLGQQGEKQDDVYDIEKLLVSQPEALWNVSEDCKEAPFHTNYFFAEPLFGYYNMADPYILRKHIEFFIAADIDFIALDYTNGLVYDKVWPKLFELLEEYRLAGWKVPQVTFLAKTRSDWVVSYVYEHIHSQNLYPELWFYGPYDKPLIVAPKESLTEEQLEFYHVREPQWPNAKRDNAAFPYMDWTRPQTVFEDLMSVSVAQHTAGAFSFSKHLLSFACGTENRGRGYSQVTGENCTEAVNACVNFIEQWDHAVEVDPEIVFVTGWNEWTALKLKNQRDLSYPLWVDTFNVEFSRDIEMTKGYYDDNFYLQLIKQVRRYKGVQAVSTWAPNLTFPVEMDASQWLEAGAVYANIATKKEGRDFAGYVPKYHYIQPIPDNFIREVRVAHDDENLYFRIQTKDAITQRKDAQRNWMNVFIGIDVANNSGPSWIGFQYVVNREFAGSLSKVETEGFRLVGKVACSVRGPYMQLAIPFSALGLTLENLRIRFKVADSIANPENIMDYYVSGDTVPLGRLAFTYGE